MVAPSWMQVVFVATFVLVLTAPPTHAIRGALFRSGRSQFNANNNLQNALNGEIPSSGGDRYELPIVVENDDPNLLLRRLQSVFPRMF
uniref:Secreted protein n=1 Tax=Panagrellus redivivus TaxID=6233 RepID=A0A7E4V3Y9_PANRE